RFEFCHGWLFERSHHHHHPRSFASRRSSALAEELAQSPHRLIDIRDPAEPYSVADFLADAEREIADIHAQQKIPLLVGGTMLYRSEEHTSELQSREKLVCHLLLEIHNTLELT